MRSACAAAFIAFVVCAGVARADDRPSVGLTLNASVGTHRESTGQQQVPLLPIPLLAVRVPFKRIEIEIESLPPVTVGYDSGISLVTKSTRISYLSGNVRYHFPHSPWSVGYGAILYNQETVYRQMGAVPLPLPCPDCMSTLTQFERSRIGGARYEIGYFARLLDVRSFSLTFGVTPVMHALVHEEFSYRSSFTEPESASQVDGQLRFALQARRLTFVYGIRYINYVARFDSNGAISDHNTFLMPFGGIFVPLGK